jgi:hypothetical protein
LDVQKNRPFGAASSRLRLARRFHRPQNACCNRQPSLNRRPCSRDGRCSNNVRPWRCLADNRRNRPEWIWKERALQEAATAFRTALNSDYLNVATLVPPIPPSKARTDPLYDDRMPSQAGVTRRRPATAHDLAASIRSACEGGCDQHFFPPSMGIITLQFGPPAKAGVTVWWRSICKPRPSFNSVHLRRRV